MLGYAGSTRCRRQDSDDCVLWGHGRCGRGILPCERCRGVRHPAVLMAAMASRAFGVYPAADDQSVDRL
jgi:hypothetical protein